MYRIIWRQLSLIELLMTANDLWRSSRSLIRRTSNPRSTTYIIYYIAALLPTAVRLPFRVVGWKFKRTGNHRRIGRKCWWCDFVWVLLSWIIFKKKVKTNKVWCYVRWDQGRSLGSAHPVSLEASIVQTLKLSEDLVLSVKSWYIPDSKTGIYFRRTRRKSSSSSGTFSSAFTNEWAKRHSLGSNKQTFSIKTHQSSSWVTATRALGTCDKH